MPKGGRSTRDQCLRNADAAMTRVDMAIALMQRIDQRAADRSVWISEQLPVVVVALQASRAVIKMFREGL